MIRDACAGVRTGVDIMGLTEAGNRPPRPAHAGGLSKSATKARIGPKHRKRIVDISRFPPRPISLRSAFVADLDTPRPDQPHKPHPPHSDNPRITFNLLVRKAR